jgi:hypothetical protein
MTESAGLRVDLLKPHVRAILDETRRAGPDACRIAHYEADARLSDELRLAADVGHVACAGLHVLAAVAKQISADEAAEGDTDHALQHLLDSVEYERAAQACEQAS